MYFFIYFAFLYSTTLNAVLVTVIMFFYISTSVAVQLFTLCWCCYLTNVVVNFINLVAFDTT